MLSTDTDRQRYVRENSKKDSLLGMSHGTAMARLRKMVLFSILKRIGENVCYRCHLEIDTPEELSFDHMREWQSGGVELFWDVDNIAFSHHKCNSAQSGKNTSDRVKAKTPEGMAWCGGHKDYHPVREFHRNRSKWNGLNSCCKHWRKLPAAW